MAHDMTHSARDCQGCVLLETNSLTRPPDSYGRQTFRDWQESQHQFDGRTRDEPQSFVLHGFWPRTIRSMTESMPAETTRAAAG